MTDFQAGVPGGRRRARSHAARNSSIGTSRTAAIGAAYLSFQATSARSNALVTAVLSPAARARSTWLIPLRIRMSEGICTLGSTSTSSPIVTPSTAATLTSRAMSGAAPARSQLEIVDGDTSDNRRRRHLRQARQVAPGHPCLFAKFTQSLNA